MLTRCWFSLSPIHSALCDEHGQWAERFSMAGFLRRDFADSWDFTGRNWPDIKIPGPVRKGQGSLFSFPYLNYTHLLISASQWRLSEISFTNPIIPLLHLCTKIFNYTSNGPRLNFGMQEISCWCIFWNKLHSFPYYIYLYLMTHL